MDAFVDRVWHLSAGVTLISIIPKGIFFFIYKKKKKPYKFNILVSQASQVSHPRLEKTLWNVDEMQQQDIVSCN